MTALSWTFFFLALFQPFQFPDTKQKPPNSYHFSILDVTIGKDNLVTVQKKLGTGKQCRAKEHDGVEIMGYTDSPAGRSSAHCPGFPHKFLDSLQREGFTWG